MDKREDKKHLRTEEWIPKTDLGYLVKQRYITSLDQLFKHCVRVQEPEIIDFLAGTEFLREEVLSLQNVQKQGKAGQSSSKKVVVVVGNDNGYIGYGTGSAKETADAIKKALVEAKLNLLPIKRGQWQGDTNDFHTIQAKGSGKSGCKRIRIFPAPVGTGHTYGPIQRKIFKLAGINDVFIKSYGSGTRENQVKALIMALYNSSSYYTPKEWNSSNNEEHVLTSFGDQIAEFRSSK